MDKKFYRILFFCAFLGSTYLLLKDGSDSSFLKMYFNQYNFRFADKVAHVIVFGVLSILGVLSFYKQRMALLIGLVIYGIIIEFLQEKFTVTRSFDLYDMIADTVGVIIGFYITQIKFVDNILKLRN